MRDQRNTSQRIALTGLEGIRRLPMALWSILETKREAMAPRRLLVQQARKHPPRFMAADHQELGVLGTAADGAVAPSKEGEHPSQTGGSSVVPRIRGQNDFNLSLGTAANGAETPSKTGVHSKRVRPAEPSNLTGRSPGQGISFQSQMSSGSELSEAYSWLRYVPNRLRPKGPSIQDQCWCFSMRGRMILFLWTIVFTPIIHDYRHMLWHLIPGDHLNHWVMTYWRTNRMANSARRPLKAG